MLRVQRTYDVLITRHGLRGVGQNQRPRLESSILFYGRRGTLEMELWGKDRAFCGAVSPAFYSRSGETLAVPDEFHNAVTRISAAVCCVGCRHCHLLQPKPIASRRDGGGTVLTPVTSGVQPSHER